MKRLIIILFIFIFTADIVSGQEYEKCGELDSTRVQEELSLRGDHWGYGYQDLLVDLTKWRSSPYITIDSIGNSVLNRALWELRISSDSSNIDKHIIYIHVRTHPNEVQSFWVANEIIKLLTSEDSLVQNIRDECVFYIVPMYNPDGVELEYPRENANKIDIEGNWFADTVQPEVKALRKRFVKLMGSNSPIELALNMHSAYKCKRYFVYHHQNGTSQKYTQIEKLYINFVVSYFVGGIEPWNFFITWKNGTPRKYPESWWWLNFKEKVLALTYEDGNCEEAGDYDKTAYAILTGIADYFGLNSPDYVQNEIKYNDMDLKSTPNPVKVGESVKIKVKLNMQQKIKIDLIDISANKIVNIYTGIVNSELNIFNCRTSNLKPSIYILRLSTKTQTVFDKMILY